MHNYKIGDLVRVVCPCADCANYRKPGVLFRVSAIVGAGESASLRIKPLNLINGLLREQGFGPRFIAPELFMDSVLKAIAAEEPKK